jgi:hypothetical protein
VRTNIANSIIPVLADYVYIGGGILTLIIIVLIVLFLVRRV